MAAKLLIQQLLLAGLMYILTAGPLAAQQAHPEKYKAILLSPDFKEVSIQSFLRYIEKNTGLSAIYVYSITQNLKPITYRQQKVPLFKMLDTVLGRLGLEYTIIHSAICLRRVEQPELRHNKFVILKGRITDEKGNPLGNVSVGNPANKHYAITSQEGIFQLPWQADSGYLEVSHIAYEKEVLHVNNADTFQCIVLKSSFEALQEVLRIYYDRTSWYDTAFGSVARYNSRGSFSRIKGEELERSGPHSNPISALSGRVPGLIVNEASGAPGAVVNMQIRGRQSIGTMEVRDHRSLNAPLIILNGIPLITGNRPVTQLSSVAGDPEDGGGISALAAINVADIETIDVLKDAEAAAIYGARGAHGVIRITTRSGPQGWPRLRFSMQSGAVTSTHLPSLLNNREYTAMRKEALAAAGVQPTVANAPDLLLLDTNNYINLPKLLAGGTGKLTNVNVSLQGGNSLLQYYLSGSSYWESSVMPAQLPQQRLTTYAHIRYRSRRWQAALSLHNSDLNYQSIAADPMYSARLVPLLPALRDANGRLTWEHNGFSFINPLGQFATRNHTHIHTFNTSFQGQYRLWPNLIVRATFGYQWLPVNELLKIPLASRNPATMPIGEAVTAYSQYEGYLAEPQLVYDHKGDSLNWGALLGATFQEERRQGNTVWGTGYANDGVLGLSGAAAEIVEKGYTATYFYRSLFGRWQADWRNRYFFNATGRLEASSRLRSQRKMTFFGTLDAAWAFSKEKWMGNWSWLSLGKLRAGYGTTGNDNRGDDSDLETWTRQPNLQPKDGIPVLRPKQQASPLLGWEKSRKLEIALELDIFHKFRFNVAWYRNSTSDQFIAEKIAGQAGPNDFRIVNWPAKVLNTGWELTAQASHNLNKKYSLTSTFLLTLPRNRLASFPGIENTPYNTTLVVGQPLSVQQGYPFLGVDPNSGLFTVPSTTPKKGVIGHREPVVYASWFNECRLGQFRISILLEARKQKALSPGYYTYIGSSPGRWSPTQLTNQPVAILQRWQQPGDQASLQRFTAANTPAVQQALHYFRASDAMIVDASFWRIRSLHLSWDLPGSWWKGVIFNKGSIYLQAQNLFTGTPYRDGDPTILYPLKLPSLRTITAGLKIDF